MYRLRTPCAFLLVTLLGAALVVPSALAQEMSDVIVNAENMEPPTVEYQGEL